jgi:hypothetical protein
MHRLLALALVVAVPRAADAFCGFYVAGSGDQLVNDATQVVLMRKGTRTVLAMQNDYKGPPSDFAMVVPVPTVLHERDVKTLSKEVFAHVEAMGAPRLVEYWEQDPCFEPEYERRKGDGIAYSAAPQAARISKDKDFGVTIEAQFVVGEYQIVILSAKDSTGLDAWLHANKYQIPAGAEPLLRPYVEGGMKFFVAKVDPAKVKFENGHAALSPLRFHYDSDEFVLPIRLGLANSSGTQDLIVNIFSPSQRYKVANYDNVTIPTNLDVKDAVRTHFGAFYAALFDATLAKHPGAVVTEYAWQATSCDPCPGPTLSPSELSTLGGDVLDDHDDSAAKAKEATDARNALMQAMQQHKPQAEIERLRAEWQRLAPSLYRRPGSDLVLTRLHARYGKDIKDDLHFEKADPIVGGREHVVIAGKLEEGAQPAAMNNFQARYAIRHPWTGEMKCEHPRRGVWGGPPRDQIAQDAGVKPATGLAFVPRDEVKLASVVLTGVPELGLAASSIAPVPTATPTKTEPAKKTGCCDSSGSTSPLLSAATLLLVLRRRRQR